MAATHRDNEQVNVGIVGCGVIGQRHLQAAHQADGIAIAAVADLVPELARQAATRYAASSHYSDGIDLISDPNVEAVVLALPAGGRADLGVAALRAGKHLLVEKPPARSSAEVEAMLAVQGELVAACCSSRYRFHESAAVAADCVRSGALGDLREVYARVHRPALPRDAAAAPPPEWRASRVLNGGGIAVNWSSYDLDFLLGITGWQLRPRTTLARSWPVARHLASRVAPGSDAESHFVALVLCDDSVALHLERSEFVALEGEQAWEIISEEFLKPLGITQKHLAEHVGCDIKVINRVVNGRTSIGADLAVRLAGALETTAEFWLNAQLAVDVYAARHRIKTPPKPLVRG